MDKLKQEENEIFDLIREDGTIAHHLCIGVNWDTIDKQGVLSVRRIKIDMDVSCIIFDEHANIVDVVYYYQTKSKEGAIMHLVDDRYLEDESEDVYDNEIIIANLAHLNPKAQRLVILLNSYDKIDFERIPHMRVRVYDGKPNKPEEIFAQAHIYNQNNLFSGYLCMLIAEVYKHDDDKWTFSPIFELTEDANLEDSIRNIKKRLL